LAAAVVCGVTATAVSRLLPAPPDAPVGNLPTIVYQHGYVVMTAVLLAVLARRAVTGVPPRF
jgi:hypothetical protein